MEELLCLPWNLQATQAPSHLLTDVTETGGGGTRREEGGGTSAPRKTFCMGYTLPATVLRGRGDIFENPHKEAPINNYECLFP